MGGAGNRSPPVAVRNGVGLPFAELASRAAQLVVGILAPLLACVISPAVSRAQGDRSALPLEYDRLDNGLEVVVVQNHTAPIATVLVAVRGGAAMQAAGEEGLAHLMEHALFRSLGDSFLRETSKLKAFHQGLTGLEVVCYYLTLPSENAVTGIRLLGRLTTDADFDRDDVEDEREIVLDELARARSDPEQHLGREVSRYLWESEWHARDVSGDSSTLRSFTEDDLRRVFDRFYVPENAALIVTGDVDPASVFRAAEEHFGDWEPRLEPFDPDFLNTVRSLAGSSAVLISGHVPYVTFMLALSGPNARHDPSSTYSADALFGIINDPLSSFQERLVESGLFESVEASFLALGGAGPIIIVAKSTPPAATIALPELLAELDSLHALAGVTGRDLAAEKKRVEVDRALDMEATEFLAPELAFRWAGPGLGYFADYHEGYAALTLDDLRSFAQRYLANRPLVLGILAPPDAAASLEALLYGTDDDP